MIPASALPDGLYSVQTVAGSYGFGIFRGRLVFCHPRIAKTFHFWKHHALKLSDIPDLAQ